MWNLFHFCVETFLRIHFISSESESTPSTVACFIKLHNEKMRKFLAFSHSDLISSTTPAVAKQHIVQDENKNIRVEFRVKRSAENEKK